MADDPSVGSDGDPAPARGAPDPADPEQNGPELAGDFFAGLVLMLVGLYALYESVRMPFYGDSGVWGSPGLTPGLISAILIALSAMLMFRSRGFKTTDIGLTLNLEARRGWFTFAFIAAYIAVLPVLGYVPATFLMLFFFQLAFTRTRNIRFLIIWALGLSAVLTAALYYLFGEFFLIPLPKGFLGV